MVHLSRILNIVVFSENFCHSGCFFAIPSIVEGSLAQNSQYTLTE